MAQSQRRITTIWTLQDFGLIPQELDIKTVISVADGRHYKLVKIHTGATGEELEVEKETLDAEMNVENEVAEVKRDYETSTKNV